MNFLAHSYLSAGRPDILIGNFSGDYIKGKQYKNYPENIAFGILLHREIDCFTDQHALVKKSKQYFRESYGKYAGIVVDLIYDHFLSVNWPHFSKAPLSDFIIETHKTLILHYSTLPIHVKQFLPHLIANQRLLSYSSIRGIIESLKAMSKYSSLPAYWKEAESQLSYYYKEINNDFMGFFPDIIKHLQQNFPQTDKKESLQFNRSGKDF